MHSNAYQGIFGDLTKLSITRVHFFQLYAADCFEQFFSLFLFFLQAPIITVMNYRPTRHSTTFARCPRFSFSDSSFPDFQMLNHQLFIHLMKSKMETLSFLLSSWVRRPVFSVQM